LAGTKKTLAHRLLQILDRDFYKIEVQFLRCCPRDRLLTRTSSGDEQDTRQMYTATEGEHFETLNISVLLRAESNHCSASQSIG